ncbi:putative transcription factor C2H2 family [Helianthus debilis subsp. tardiflorus]
MSSNQKTQTAFSILILLQLLPHVRSQNPPPPPPLYADFNPSIITIIVILIAALFLMFFFTIYIRRQSTEGGVSIRRALSTRRANAPSRGLDPSVIETFPTFVYSTVKGLKIGKGALECAVCLNEYEDEETIRLIPKCDHVFHPECIDAWLQSHVTCPVCRANLVPDSLNVVVSDPVSTSVNEEVVVNVQEQTESLNQSSMIPRLFDKFRSHSTGHSLVQPGENMDRFTLRLPADVRKQVVSRALLNRNGMVGEGSERNGYRRKSYKRLQSLDRVMVRSERWVMSRAPSFLSRALSIRSPRVVVSGNGEASTSSTTPKGSKTPDTIPLNNLGPKSC